MNNYPLVVSEDTIKQFMQRPITRADFDKLHIQMLSELEVPAGSVRLPRITSETYDRIAFLCEHTNVILKIHTVREDDRSQPVPLAQIVAVYEESGSYYSSDILSLKGTECPLASDAFDTWKAEIDQLKKYWWVIEEKIVDHLMVQLFPQTVVG